VSNPLPPRPSRALGPLTVVTRPTDEAEDAVQRPLEWSLIRRLVGIRLRLAFHSHLSS
jgi:hypothetical protein